MYHHGPNDIICLRFAFSNSILLGGMREECLMNNVIFGIEGKYIIFYILQGIDSIKYMNGSRKLIFYFIREKLNNS